MSRSGYDDDGDNWGLIRWRGAVASAIRGKRGQAFLREMLTAMEALPQPRLIARELEADGEVCAIGSVGRARALDMSDLDPYDYETIAATFGIPQALVREIECMNDEVYHHTTPEQRHAYIRQWVLENLRPDSDLG